MTRIYISFILSLLFLNLVSCKTLLKTLYGIHPQNNINTERINSFYSALPIKEFQKVILDTSYLKWINLNFKTDSIQAYYHIQPLQALYFDSTNNMVSFHVNCNAGGFPNLQWNRNDIFGIFPPITQTKVDTLFDLNAFIKMVLPKNQKSRTYDYTVIIFWNFFLERQAKRLINQVLNNLNLTDKKVDIIFVNNDNLYLKK